MCTTYSNNCCFLKFLKRRALNIALAMIRNFLGSTFLWPSQNDVGLNVNASKLKFSCQKGVFKQDRFLCKQQTSHKDFLNYK